MGKVFSLLLQEESQRSLTNTVGISVDSHAMAAGQYHNHNHRPGSTYVPRFLKQKGKPEATCSHCGYPGHLVDKCFQIIGYPPGWKGPKGKRIATMPHINRNYQTPPIAQNAVISEQKQEPPNIIFSQEQTQNLLTLANSISNSKLHHSAKEQESASVSPPPSQSTPQHSVPSVNLPSQNSAPSPTNLPQHAVSQLRRRGKKSPSIITGIGKPKRRHNNRRRPVRKF
uniref:CCHC-type domain-containing protein n=1 Tax=Populus alba TaxID=43335 RepID=A0A4U5P308_POPAL|nr:hypothetical protein D5086_0000232710 [Populus alba]